MKQYTTIIRSDLKEMDYEVAKLLNEGWKPVGGVSMAYKHEHGEGRHIPGHLVYAQAMLKEDDQE